MQTYSCKIYFSEIKFNAKKNPKTTPKPKSCHHQKRKLLSFPIEMWDFTTFRATFQHSINFFGKINPSFLKIVDYLGRGNKQNKRFMDPSFSWGRRKWSVCRSYIFRHFAETSQPPSIADCKIRKLLPSWGNNRLPQCFSAQPAAASESGNYSSRITFFSYSLFLWARSPPTASMYFLCKIVEEVTF